MVIDDRFSMRPKNSSHRRSDWRKGLSLVSNARDSVVARRGRTEILLIIHAKDSREQRSRAYRISWWHRKDLGYGKLHDAEDTSTEIDYHVFIARQDEMGVGSLLVARARNRPTWCEWNRSGSKPPHRPGKRQPQKDPTWKFAFVGVLPTRRRHGLARLLIETASKHFGVKVCECAWGLPFQPDGEALVRRLCPKGFWSG